VLYHDGLLNTLFGKPEIAMKRFTLAADQIAAANPAAPKEAALADLELMDAFGIAALRLQKLPSDLDADQLALVRTVGHAQALVALQDRATAGIEFKDIVARFGSEPGIHYIYGVFLLKEEPSLASDEFKKEVALSPSDAAPRIQLALGYLRTGEYQEGLRYAKDATELAPENFVAHVACGRIWMELGNSESAIKELQTAVRLAPGSPDAHFALARALSKGGRAKEAAREQAEFERLKALADAANQGGL
jgi:tetratricopeptide (TPR) repeat protein